MSFEVFSNTVLFVNAAGKPVKVAGDIVVNYQYVDPGYDGALVRRVNAAIADYDAPGVLILETQGSTNVIEFDGSIIPGLRRDDHDRRYGLLRQRAHVSNSTWAPPSSRMGMPPLVVNVTADLDLASEFITLDAEGIALGDLFDEAIATGTELSTTAQDTLTLTEAQVTSLLSDDGKITITATPSDQVNDFAPDDPNTLSLQLSVEADTSATADALGLGRIETYQVVLTSPPTQNVEVRVRPEETVTSLIVDAIVQLKRGRQARAHVHAHELEGPAGGGPSLPSTTRWWTGATSRSFAPQPHTVAPVQGPLLIKGGGGRRVPGGDRPAHATGRDEHQAADWRRAGDRHRLDHRAEAGRLRRRGA